MSKQTLCALIALSLLSSCGTVSKLRGRSKERKEARTKSQERTATSSMNDSAARQHERYQQYTERTTTIDTDVVVPADTLMGKGKLPTDGSTATFTDGDITTDVSVTDGILNVKTTTKTKVVSVRKQVVERGYRSGDVTTEVREQSTTKATSVTKTKTDSSSTSKSATSTKTAERNTTPFLLAIGGILLFAGLLIWVFRKLNIFV